MTTLRIYNNDGDWIECDIERSQPLKISKEFDRIENLRVGADIVQEFEIPFTDKLAGFLGLIVDTNVQSWVNVKKRIQADIVTDGITMLSGNVQIIGQSVVREGVQARFRFTGKTPELLRACGEKRLKDIVALSELDYTLSDANWSDPNEHTKLTLCDKYGMVGQQPDGGLPIQDPEYPCYIGHMTPAVKTSWLFEQIVKDAGFTFDETQLRDALDDVYTPFVSGRDLVTNQRYENLFFNLGLVADVAGITDDVTPTLTEFADNGNNVASSVFTAPYFGTYTFRVWANITKTTGTGFSSLGLRLRKNNATDLGVGNSINFGSAGGAGAFRSVSYPVSIQLNAGDTLILKIAEIAGAGTYTIEGNADNNPQLGTGWQLDAATAPMLGDSVTVIMRENAPDIRQVDFVNGIIRALKLAIVPDDTVPNRMIIRPMTSYIGSGDTVDWTPVLDISQPINITPTTDLQAKKFQITYKADGDAANKFYTEQQNRTFGRYEITEENTDAEEINEFSTDEQNIQLPFGASPCDEINGTTIIAPRFINEGGQFVLPTCRLLYVTGTATVETVTPAFAQVQRSVYTVSNYSDSIPDVDSFDLNFGIEQPLHQVLAYPYQTLWFRFWAAYYRELYSREARIMEAQFALSSLDVLNISFADKIWIENETIGNGYWRLLNIYDFDPDGEKTTKCRLIKLLNLGLDCDQIPASRAVNGQIIFSGENTDGTRKCCEKYGHVWDEAQGKCFRVQNIVSPDNPITSTFAEIEESRARIVNVASDYYVRPNDELINVDSTGGNVNIYLPAASSSVNRRITIAHSAGNGTVKVWSYKSETIQDKADVNVGAKGTAITITATQTGWNV